MGLAWVVGPDWRGAWQGQLLVNALGGFVAGAAGPAIGYHIAPSRHLAGAALAMSALLALYAGVALARMLGLSDALAQLQVYVSQGPIWLTWLSGGAALAGGISAIVCLAREPGRA